MKGGKDMCTDRTLKEHINKYADLAAQIKELEAIKKKEGEYIMREFEARQIDKWADAKVVNQTREYADTKKMQALYPTIWDEVKKSTSYSYIRVS